MSIDLLVLNDLTDCGLYPLEPCIPPKKCGTIVLIKKYCITDEELFIDNF